MAPHFQQSPKVGPCGHHQPHCWPVSPPSAISPARGHTSIASAWPFPVPARWSRTRGFTPKPRVVVERGNFNSCRAALCRILGSWNRLMHSSNTLTLAASSVGYFVRSVSLEQAEKALASGTAVSVGDIRGEPGCLPSFRAKENPARCGVLRIRPTETGRAVQGSGRPHLASTSANGSGRWKWKPCP